MDKKTSSKLVFQHVTIGLQMAITVFIFVYGGYLLDNRFSTTPLLVSVGAFVGMGAGFYNLIRQVTAQSAMKDSDAGDSDRDRWM